MPSKSLIGGGNPEVISSVDGRLNKNCIKLKKLIQEQVAHFIIYIDGRS